MKKFTLKAITLATASVCGSAALAGAITTPVNDAAATVYAVEALTNTTDLTAANIVYTMGVARTTAQDFTVIITPSAGATFTAGSCLAALPTVVGGGGAATVSQKRSSATECAYEVDVTTAFTTATTLTFAGLTFDTHTLGTAGSTASVTIALKDLGETAFIDNVGTLTRRVATSAQAVNVYAAASDTGTVADVNAAGGPLTGFIAANGDTIIRANAFLTFDNNSIGAKDAGGVNAFDFAATTGTASLTLSGTTSGAATNGFCLDVDNDATLCEAAERFTLTSTTATLAGIASTNFPAAGSTATRQVTFLADGTTQLGTARTFALTGTITPQVGAAEPLDNTGHFNPTAWVWSANASQLMVPRFTTNANYLSRFNLMNTGTVSVGYSATCYSETGNTITYGTAKTGSLSANGLTVINAADICTFAGNARGSIIFTVNAPINTVKGSYEAVDGKNFAFMITPMTRPYNQANTTE